VATSSINLAIDYIVAGIRALSACAAPVTVHDGWPVGSGRTGVAIGVKPTDEQGNTPSDQTFAQLGANMEWEEFDIPVEIGAHVVGAEEAAKLARDAAFVIYNAVLNWVRGNRDLGGILHSYHAQIVNFDLDQTNSPTQAGDGRLCRITFFVRCKNRF
jgi:hypothetical protein